MKYMTPCSVSEGITFQRKKKSWKYDANGTLEAMQAEGVAGLWNKLLDHSTAILADEVGMGKTIQAMGVMSVLWQQKTDANVLVIAPNQSIAENWEQEYNCFLEDHYKFADNIIKSAVDGGPIYPAKYCATLDELISQCRLQSSRFLITKLTIFSLFNQSKNSIRNFQSNEDAPNSQRDNLSEKQKLKIARDSGQKYRKNILTALGGQFDLLIVDEAHNLRNVFGKSQRVASFREFTGEPESTASQDRIARFNLLLTATPNHSRNEDAKNILKHYFVPQERVPKETDVCLEKYAIRRLRILDGYTKYNYRLEQERECCFSDDYESELFFALYQKQLSLLEDNEGIPLFKSNRKNFLFGYLEGFESTGKSDKSNSEEQNDPETRADYRQAPDTKILQRLSDNYFSHLQQTPRHPKYNQCINEVCPQNLHDYFRSRTNIELDKTLLFVRRIPSCNELFSRVNEQYDLVLLKKILSAIGKENESHKLNSKQKDFRSHLNALISRNLGISGDLEVFEQSNETPKEENEILSSKVMDYFIEKKKSRQEKTYRTHGSAFRERFTAKDSLFAMFFEPPILNSAGSIQPYFQERRLKNTEYRSFAVMERIIALEHSKQEGNQAKDSNQSAELLKTTIENTHKDLNKQRDLAAQTSGNTPIETLALIYDNHCPNEDRRPWKALLNKSTGVRESFFHGYLRKGLLLASGAIAELYSWFLQAQLQSKETSDSPGSEEKIKQSIYSLFCQIVAENFSNSLTFGLMRRAIETFENVSEKIFRLYSEEEILKYEWRELNAQNPGAACSGDVNARSRQRLIRCFNTPFFPNVLITTSVLQEGVNLHLNCRRVMHYGIAWTPGDNEQRAGRVDRMFSATHQQINKFKLLSTTQQETNSHDRPELSIQFPYLAKSFDEEQVSRFIITKTRAEGFLDKATVSKTSKKINIDSSNEKWKDSLRTPEDPVDNKVFHPYPWAEHKTGPFFNWPNCDEQVGTNIRNHIKSIIETASGSMCDICSVTLHQTQKQNEWYLEPKLKGISNREHQPVHIELSYSPHLSFLSQVPVYLLEFRSPLGRRKIKLSQEIETALLKNFPFMQICEDEGTRETEFHYYARCTMPVFTTKDHIKNCSAAEIETLLRQVITGSEWLESQLFDDQDLSLKDLAKSISMDNLWGSREIINSNMPLPTSPDPVCRSWSITGDIAYQSVELSPAILQNPLAFQHNNPLLFLRHTKSYKTLLEIRFPALDFQKQEQELLGMLFEGTKALYESSEGA